MRPLNNSSSFSRRVAKNPALFGVPFILIMVAASYGLASFTQTRYDLHGQKVKQVTKEQELKLKKNRKRFDIREEYFRMNAQANDKDWENKRVPRPTKDDV